MYFSLTHHKFSFIVTPDEFQRFSDGMIIRLYTPTNVLGWIMR